MQQLLARTLLAHYDLATQVEPWECGAQGPVAGVISAPDLDTMVSQQAAMLEQTKDGVVTAQAALRLQQATYARVHTVGAPQHSFQAGRRHSTGGV